MAHVKIQDGTLTTERFGDRLQVAIPRGGKVELRPRPQHVDVEIREKDGTVHRKFRLPKEGS